MLKSNHEARARAKAEKEAEAARLEEEKRRDREHRENNLEIWLEEKRAARAETLQRIKERDRMKADLGNRKSLASQMRMKNIANLASDNPSSGSARKRRRGGNADDDDFGANDDDWGVYRQIVVGPKEPEEEGEEEEDLDALLETQEKELLDYDPHFGEEDTHAAQTSWNRSLLHAFERGPWPFDSAKQAQLNQVHLNVERIRVPEVLFQPEIAGVDQGGLGEILASLIGQRLPPVLGSSSGGTNDLLKDVFLTGGLTAWKGFKERVRDVIAPMLVVGEDGNLPQVNVRRATDVSLDAWKGAASWAGSEEWKGARIRREDYEEKGAEWFKEHKLGNVLS